MAARKRRSARQGLAKKLKAEPVRLAVALKKGDFEIDREAGTIFGLSVITRGPALGHDLDIDDVMIGQVADAINDPKHGVKSHLKHHVFEDGVNALLGKFVNGRVDGDKARADFTFGRYADKLPGYGDARTYLLDVAEEDPDAIGLSIFYDPAPDEERTDGEDRSLPPAARLKKLLAVDWVDDPAANEDGLLSEKRPGEAVSPEPPKLEDSLMNPNVRAYLVGLGLKAEATDEEALAFQEKLTPDQKAAVAALQADPPADPPVKPPTEPPPTPPTDPAELARKAAGEALAADGQRRKAIRALGVQHGLGAETVQTMCDDLVSLEDAQKKALAHLAETRRPVITVGADLNRDTLRGGMCDAVLRRANVTLYDEDPRTGLARRDAQGQPKRREAHERAEELSALPLVDLARHFLAAAGVPDAFTLGRARVAALALSRRELARAYGSTIAMAQSTSDFDHALADALGKSLRAAYMEAPSTWQIWVRRATAPDFKEIKRIAISEAPGLLARPEGAEIKYAALAEERETYALGEYAKGLVFTRQAMINDDIGFFNRIPQLQASAAVRLEDDVVYAILIANAALNDGIALFELATHGNLRANVLAAAGLNQMRTDMRTQTGQQGAILNITPRFLIVPAALESTALTLMTSEADPAATMGHAKNIWKGTLTPVVEPRLDATSATEWYAAADPNQIDTLELAFLESEQVPQLKEETQFDTDDRKYAVRHTIAAKAIDYRGLWCSTGA